MILKMYGGMALVGVSFAIGCLKSKELKERVQGLEDIKRLIVYLQGELRFHRAMLSEAFGNTAEKFHAPMGEALMEISNKLEEGELAFEKIWQEQTGRIMECEGLHRDDGQLLELLGNGLGYLDLEQQMATFDMVLQKTEAAIGGAREELKCKGKLYRTMGITTGLLLALLVI